MRIRNCFCWRCNSKSAQTPLGKFDSQCPYCVPPETLYNRSSNFHFMIEPATL